MVSAVGAEDAPEWVLGGWLAGRCSCGDFAPGPALLIHQPAVGCCGEAMAARAEVVANSTEWLKESLRLFS